MNLLIFPEKEALSTSEGCGGKAGFGLFLEVSRGEFHFHKEKIFLLTWVCYSARDRARGVVRGTPRRRVLDLVISQPYDGTQGALVW